MNATSGLPDEPHVDFELVKKELVEILDLPARDWEKYGVSGGSYLLALGEGNDTTFFRIQHIWDEEYHEETEEILSEVYRTTVVSVSNYPKLMSINSGDRTDWVNFCRQVAQAYQSLYKA